LLAPLRRAQRIARSPNATVMGRKKIVSWALAAGCMAVVLWVRLLPLFLPVIDDQADRISRRDLHEKIAREVSEQVPPERWEAETELKTREWIEKNPKEFEANRAGLSRNLKSQLSFEGENGREYVYLGDFDSYLWLRHARNYLRKGTTCDAVVDGECRDVYGMAPVGSRMLYNRSLHIAAIVGLHKFIVLFNPDYPLPAASFWVPVIIGVLGVLPAFLIGYRLGGNMGGVLTALLISLHPVFLRRSIGSDNDVWNVVLPLFALWAVIEALSAGDRLRRVMYGLLAGAFTGLHAATWRGWLFAYVVLLCGLVIHLLLSGLRGAIRDGSVRLWRAREARPIALTAAVYYAAAGIFTALAGSEESYFTIPLKAAGSVMGRFSARGAGSAIAEGYWPNAYEFVAELLKPQLGSIAELMEGRLYFFAALLGLMLMPLPERGWRWYHLALLPACLLLFGYVLLSADLGRSATMLLLGLPLAAALFCLLDPRASDGPGPALVIPWFLAALYFSHDGLRFLLLLVIPYGLALTVACIRLRALAGRVGADKRALANLLVLAVVVLVLIHPLRQGYTAARSYLPHIDDAWWDTLVKIREESHPEAIVNAGWPYGYWIKYVAEKRVSADGGSLQTHAPHWLAKALVAPTEKESIGILRMLNCGSDATPWPEGRLGAYGKIRATGRDWATAYGILADLVKSSEIEARSYLAKHGFAEAEQASILRSTHCVPPESYLIISGAEIRRARSWMHLGMWDIRRAYVAGQAGFLPEAEGGKNVAEQLGDYSSTSTEWLPCRAVRGVRELVCGMDAPDGQEGSMAFLYDPSSPKNSKVHMSGIKGQRPSQGTPGLIILAGAARLEEIEFPSPTYADIGVVVDVANRRVLSGSPRLIRSTLLRLMYLEGKYSAHYEKFSEKTAFSGDRVVAWRIRWAAR
jgi:asparagine N-glycosylation enzyme membrane subunit Stt3